MKRRFAIALALGIVLALFFAARNAASWRPQLLTPGEFRASLAPSTHGFSYSLPLNEAEKRAVKIARAKGWRLRAIAPDGKRLLAQNSDCPARCAGAFLDRDGQLLVRLDSPQFGYWFGAAFSPDGRFAALYASEAGPTQVFDAQTGALLWDTKHWVESVRFSPDGVYAVFPDSNGQTLIVVEARGKREVKRLPYLPESNQWGFSRDGGYLLAQTSPGKYARLRLR